MIKTIKSIAVRMYASKAAKHKLDIDQIEKRMGEISGVAGMSSFRESLVEELIEANHNYSKALKKIKDWSK